MDCGYQLQLTVDLRPILAQKVSAEPPAQVGCISNCSAVKPAAAFRIVGVCQNLGGERPQQTSEVDGSLPRVTSSDRQPDRGVLHRCGKREILLDVEAGIFMQNGRNQESPKQVVGSVTGHSSSKPLGI